MVSLLFAIAVICCLRQWQVNQLTLIVFDKLTRSPPPSDQRKIALQLNRSPKEPLDKLSNDSYLGMRLLRTSNPVLSPLVAARLLVFIMLRAVDFHGYPELGMGAWSGE